MRETLRSESHWGMAIHISFLLLWRDYIESLKGDSETVSGGIQKAAWDRECETLKFKRIKN